MHNVFELYGYFKTKSTHNGIIRCMLKKFYKKYRYSVILLRELVIVDFKMRYQGSALGYLWSLLRPLFLFVILYVVFVYFLRIGSNIPHWPVALLLGTVVWNFFMEITKQGLKSIVGSSGIIRKINFPKYVILLATSFSALINLAINLIVIVIFALINHIEFSWSSLLIIPLIFEVFIFGLGLAFILATINVKYRDVGYIWEIVSQALFYGSAVMYPISRILAKGHHVVEILLLNPVAQAIQDARHFAVSKDLMTLHTLTDNIFVIIAPFAITIIVFTIGAVYFRKRSPYFAEEV